MLDIKALEKALESIGGLGRGELTFAVNDVEVTMRVLTADEDITVNRYARESAAAKEDGSEDESDGLSLLERYKRATLSYAIVQVGPVDLRGVDFVATGGVTDKGVPVRVPRHVAVRKIVDGWTRVATVALFQKYLELVNRVDAEAERAVQFNVQDLDAEISRVEKRLAELKQEKERAAIARTGGSPVAFGDADKAAQERIRNLTEAAAGKVAAPAPAAPAAPEVEAEAEEPSPQFALPPRQPPQRAAAPVAPPPVPREARPVEPVVRQRVAPPVVAPPSRPAPVAPPAPQAAPPQPEGTSFEGMMDSLGDSPEALAAETARLQAMRAQARRASLDAAQQAVAEQEMAVVPGNPARRAPPHRAAHNVQNSLLDSGASTFEAARPAPSVGDKEAFRLGTAPIVDRARPAVPPSRKVAVNEKPKDSPNNPRFRPAGR